MLLVVLVVLLVSGVISHREISPLYKSFQASKGLSIEGTVEGVRKVFSPSSSDQQSRSAKLFVPPRPDQSPVDYHPQRKNLPTDDEPLVFYSWHIHAYFFQENANVTARCLAMRDQFIAFFNISTCNDDCFMGGPFDTCDSGAYGFSSTTFILLSHK